MKKYVVFAIVLLVFFYFLAKNIALFQGENFESKSLSTQTSSVQFKTIDERINFLEKYVTLYSAIDNTEFIIFYQDNSIGLVPGPSDWDIKMALKVPKGSVDYWLDGFVEAKEEEVKLSWWNDLKLDSKIWERDSIPKYYKRPKGRVYLVVYEKEAIILKMISTFPQNK